MAKTWIQEEFVDWRFGFPVHLLQVPMKEVRGEAVPVVNGQFLRFAVLSALTVKPSALTGHEVRFLRLWLEKTLSEFGRELGVTHAAIKKWEDQKDAPTGTHRVNDFYIRYLVLEKLLQDELFWLLSAESQLPPFLQKFKEIVTQDRQSPLFLQKVREMMVPEIAEPSDTPPVALSVVDIPLLVSHSAVQDAR